MCNRVLPLFEKLLQWNLHVNCHVNGTTFQSGLRFQTDLSSLWVSCKRALNRFWIDTLLNFADSDDVNISAAELSLVHSYEAGAEVMMKQRVKQVVPTCANDF